MRFSTPAGALADALANARHATPTNAAMVAYSGVLLQVRGAKLSVIGSDGDTTIAAVLDVAGAADGQTLLPPRPLGAWLATVGADETVEVSAGDGSDVEVRAGGTAPYRFRPIAATFPLPAAPKTPPVAADLSRLGAALGAVRASSGKDFAGVQLVSGADGLVLHTTDSYRLSRAELPEAGFGDFVGVVPLGLLERLARHPITSVAADPNGRTLRFAGPGIVVSTRLLNVPFPAVDSVLGTPPPSAVRVPVRPVRAALARLAAVADAEPVRCHIDGASLELSVQNADLGSGAETVTLAEAAIAPFTFGVNRQFLAEAFAAHDADEVSLAWSSAAEPLFVSSTAPLAVTTLVMPVRL